MRFFLFDLYSWVFQVDSIDTSKNMINFSRGGFQEARGGTISNNYYFVENVMEELDAPGTTSRGLTLEFRSSSAFV